ncbi:MAG: alanine--tRNA ligase [Clostridiales bacterium]|nr:alanine--tRNA ligase [Clostridiales bacterium]
MIKSDELRSKFLNFFQSKGHTIIQGASLIPENDPSVLFTTAGMHPLVPYLLGQPHPQGTRLTDVQKCVRTGDIDEVGDASHLTFFEMLGNWSLGDYFKKEAIAFSWEFLTSPKWLGLDPDKLYFTVFAGDEDSPRDTEAASYWMENGVKEDHIFYLPKENNWWWAGAQGPCGPDTEMFIDTGKPKCSETCSPACDCGKYLEIWNDVFMQYNRNADGKLSPLTKKNVDTGMGLERTIGVLQGVKSVYETDLFTASLNKIAEISGKKYGESEDVTKAFRVIADHIRTATFILGDPKAVTPSNVDQGYVLRRLIRRAIRFANSLEMPVNSIIEISKVYIEQYKRVYPELQENSAFVIEQLRIEEDRFTRTLKQGLKEFEKVSNQMSAQGKTVVDGQTTFHLYDTFGFPPEITNEMAREKGYSVDMQGFEECFKEHQKKSSQGSEQRFKGGLAEQTEETARLHTATHLMHSALRKVLNDPDVHQKGSNITSERLRFDFTFGRKVTREELDEVEKLVNQAIEADVEIICEQMPLEEAKASGAIGLFESKYDTVVKVYTMGEYSKEICGGPHAARTGELGKFKIKKEESSSAGVRRIKAVLE